MFALEFQEEISADQKENSQKPCATLPPWAENHYKLISWWDMEKFSAERFVDIGRRFGMLQIYLRHKEHDAFNVEHRELIEAQFKHIQKSCAGLGLKFSLKGVDRALSQKLDQIKICREAIELISDIETRFMDEMGSSLFLHIPQDREDWYLKPLEGWEQTVNRFPNIQTEIEEASKSFACDRYAASVFHSTQIAEFGAIEIGKLIEIEDVKLGWPSTIREMDRIIHRAKYPELTEAEKKYRDLIGQLLPEMQSMESGWRHKISHVANRLILMSSEFSPEVAEEIYVATRAFMRRLATEMP